MLWSGWAASVSVVLLATVAVAAVPRARGIGFFPELRYAVVTPVCIAVAVAAAFLYRLLAPRPNRRAILAVVLFALAAAFLAGFALAGPPGLAAAGVPAVLVVAILSAVLVPKFVERPRRSTIGMIAIVLSAPSKSLVFSLR
ncbi:MAG TPA: hypothetical protein VHK66_07840 [Microvirga sp.]|nr:hypothetical protein [Microvirga sp.]